MSLQDRYEASGSPLPFSDWANELYNSWNQPYPGDDPAELEYDQLQVTLNSIMDAIKSHRGVVMMYQGNKDREPLKRWVLPYYLVEDSRGRIYMWAYDAWRKDARVFRLDRIHQLSVREKAIDFDTYSGLAVGKLCKEPSGAMIASVLKSVTVAM